MSDANVEEALKFLVHFIGDLTQPLHDEALETGGNDIKVTFDGYSDNLHSDWDTYIPEKKVGGSALSDAQDWANTLVEEIKSGNLSSQAASWIDGDDVSDAVATATKWASDANSYVCSVVMPDGVAALQKGDLYPDYYNSAIGTVELQIAKGGYRLGNWLNLIYKSGVAKRDLSATGEREGSIAQSDIQGRDFLPARRAPSRAQLARAAMGGSCCNSREHSH